jgi:hypothetical protein
MRQVGVRELKARLMPGWKSGGSSGEKFIKDMRAIAEEMSKYLPPGTSAVEAVKEQRRDL